MKCQKIFAGKNKPNVISLSSVEIAQTLINVIVQKMNNECLEVEVHK